MKLLFVGYMHGFGGAEKMLITLANAMSERGHQVSLVSMVSNNSKYNISDKIKYIFVPDNGKNKIAILINRYVNLRKTIKIIEPDLIVNFWLQSTYMCAFMGKKFARKTIYSERGDPSDKEYDGLLGFVRKITFNKIRGIVFQSKGARDYFSSNVRKKSCIIHNPVFINPSEWEIPSEREKRIVTVGRLHEQKNQKLLIEAVNLLPPDKKEYITEIYGDGELKEELQKQIDKLGLQDRVRLMGTYSDIYQRIHKASLFVLTSDYEGLPNALIEAMALGLPCISTDCKPGGAREIIDNNKNGLIIKRDDKIELAKTINDLLNNKKMEQQFSNEAVKKIHQFSPHTIYDKWEKLFLISKGN